MTVVDMSGVKDFTPVPVGEYIVTLSGVKVKPSKNGKSDNANFEYTISEDDDNIDDNDEPYHGQKLWQNHNLSPQSLFKLKQTLLAFDADPDDISGSFALEEVVGGLIGNKARARVVPNNDPQYPPTVAGVTALIF